MVPEAPIAKPRDGLRACFIKGGSSPHPWCGTERAPPQQKTPSSPAHAASSFSTRTQIPLREVRLIPPTLLPMQERVP
eukprot:CAMPEP_0194701722 /NCGR_PEP_ID=MMETSP0295-20121207/26397_1 /TAXON_ID=39354 /ORGANISM="Heterosigma akashiwo, Strain CCMP2393" /LENGTH=77 /DNA_ID=CAMNT_0039596051 /DNA_START=162 /DNA_END=395 /DNA_ORIENTATION=+